MPFLSEMMYQNLKAPGEPESVHLCDYPNVDTTLIDNQLSTDMRRLLRLVSLGSAARNTAKLKVRQPLAEMKVQPALTVDEDDDEVREAREQMRQLLGRELPPPSADERDQRVVERFADQICEELNVKKVMLHDPVAGPPLLRQLVKPNMKTLGPKFGPRLKEVQAALTAADPAVLARDLEAGKPVELPCPGGAVTIEPGDVFVQLQAPEGWAGVADRGTQVAIDTRITPELAREGMAREVIRHVQQARKDAGLEMEDRITLYLGTESAALRQAIDAHRDYIAAETLTVRWSDEPLGDGAHTANVKVDGQALTIQLRKV
jgi:isoleucyl-tRNA synthetase